MLTLIASGRTTGLVCDSGNTVTYASSIYDGFLIPDTVEKVEIAGENLTEHLQQLLLQIGVSVTT
jgi:centractin